MFRFYSPPWWESFERGTVTPYRQCTRRGAQPRSARQGAPRGIAKALGSLALIQDGPGGGAGLDHDERERGKGDAGDQRRREVDRALLHPPVGSAHGSLTGGSSVVEQATSGEGPESTRGRHGERKPAG